MNDVESVKISSEIQTPMNRAGQLEDGTSYWCVPFPYFVLTLALIDIRMLKN
jgi:hypothetical protein